MESFINMFWSNFASAVSASMDTILGIAERLLITKKNDGGYEKGG